MPDSPWYLLNLYLINNVEDIVVSGAKHTATASHFNRETKSLKYSKKNKDISFILDH